MIRSLKEKRFIEPLIEMQEDYRSACLDADAIVYHPGVVIGHFIACEKKIPSIIASPFPMSVTGKYPALVFYRFRLPKFLNRLTHRLFISGFWMAAGFPLKKYYKNKKQSVKLYNPLTKDHVAVSCSNLIFETPETVLTKDTGICQKTKSIRHQNPCPGSFPSGKTCLYRFRKHRQCAGCGKIYITSDKGSNRKRQTGCNSHGVRGIELRCRKP